MIRSNWILGKPFLKKYFFSFNYDDKILTFYETEKKENISNNDDENIKNFILILVIIILVAIFALLGFLLAKFIYNYKKRIATELLDEDDENENINSINNQDKKIVEPIMDNNDI
jgi:uncharacterized protein YqhQ